MKAFWRKTASAPHQSSGRRASLHIEQVGRAAVRGWAITADGRDGELQVLIDGRRVDVPVQRVARPDVLVHLGIASGEDTRRPGFEIGLDAEQWQRWSPRGAAVPVELRLDGDVAVPVSLSLDDTDVERWARELLADTASVQDAEWPRLSTFLARDADRWAWVWDAWARQGGAPGTRVRGALESIDGVVLSGWASDPGGLDEVFVVRLGDCVLHPAVARHDRDDVRRSLPGAGALTGFELLLPVGLWRTVADSDEVLFDVLVNGRRLTDAPLTLNRGRLARQLIEAADAADQASGSDLSAARDRCAMLLEHVLAARAIGTLNADEQLRLRAWGGGRLAEFGEPAASALNADARDPAVPAPAEFGASLWALQRRFNHALAGVEPTASHLLAALQSALQSAEAQSAAAVVRARFVVMMVPAFCAADGLQALRPLLDDADVDRLIHADGAWELSLILPVVLMDELAGARLDKSGLLMERIASALPAGWLNTEVLPEALRRIRSAMAEDVLEGRELRRFVMAVLQLYERVGGSPWSRLHDRHLVDAMCGLLRLQALLDEHTGAAVCAAAVRWYATTPAFWAGLAAGEVPAALVPAHSAYQAWAGACNNGQTLSEALAALADLRRLGAVDADWQERHLRARWSALPMVFGPGGLPEADGLRTDLDAAARSDVWRAIAPVPSVALRDVRRRAQQGLFVWQEAAFQQGGAPLQGLWHQVRSDWLVLAGESARFVGLRSLAQAWQFVGDASPLRSLREHIAQAIENAVQRALDIVERQRDQFSVPPAALLATLAWMASMPPGAPATWTLLVDQADSRLQTGWGALVPAARGTPSNVADRWRAPLAGLSLLVVVRLSDRDGHEGRVRRLAAWTEDLSRHAAGWCLWQPDAGPVREAASGDAAHLQGGDQLAILAWLTQHTTFGTFLFIDDDAYLAVDAFHLESGALSEHYHGAIRHRAAALRQRFAASPFIDPAQGLTVSRLAAQLAVQLAATRAGARLMLAGHDEASRLAHLLALAHVAPNADGHFVHLRRPPRDEDAGAPAFHNFWPPGPGLATVLTTLGDGEDPAEVLAPARTGRVEPPRIWPPDATPRLPGGSWPAQQLVRLSGLSSAEATDHDSPCVIAVARNERVLLPHFLAHYRSLGVRRFFLADNLSTDGSREFLATQPDVVLYSVDTAYRDSHYGVAWQLAMLAEHAQHSWAVVADIDEFLVWPGCENESLPALCHRLDADRVNAAMALMVDMYPVGSLDEADFERGRPFDEAPCFDAQPCLPWRIGSGQYSNGPTFVSAVRHRLLPDSPPNHYTAQKLPLLRYHAGVRFSEGLHYAAGLQPATQPLFLAHFKYHKGFRAKVEEEVARKQHYNDAEEYRKYRALWTEARGMMFDPAVSRRYTDSNSFADIPWN